MKTLVEIIYLGFMFFLGLKTVFFNKKHLLMILLSIEFLSLIVILSLMFMLKFYCHDYYMMIYYLIVLVCEAVLGLILLTLLVRSHGNDYLKSSFIFMC